MKKLIILLIFIPLFGASDKKAKPKIMSEKEGIALVKILPQIEKLGPAGRAHLVEALRLNNSSTPKLSEDELPKLTLQQKTALDQILAQMKKLEIVGKMHLIAALDVYYSVFLILKILEQEVLDKIFAYAGINSRRRLKLTGNLFLLNRLKKYYFSITSSVADKWEYFRNNIAITDIRDKKLPDSCKKIISSKYIITELRGLNNHNPYYDTYQIAVVAEQFLLICSNHDDKVLKEINFTKLTGLIPFFFDENDIILSNDMSLLILRERNCIKLISLNDFYIIKTLTTSDLPYKLEDFFEEIELQCNPPINDVILRPLCDIIKPAFITEDGNNIVFADPFDSSKYKLILSIVPN